MHDEMWDVITDGPIQILQVNPNRVATDPTSPEMIPKEKSLLTTEERTRVNLDNIAKDILYKALDESLFPRVRKCKNAKDIWDVLMLIGDGDEQEKENKLTIAMKKFEDFKLNPKESITEMEARFIKLLMEINDLDEKKLTQKEINLKILRGLPKSWLALFMRRFKRFMRKNQSYDNSDKTRRMKYRSNDKASGSRTHEKDEIQVLCYNCRKPGHFKAECPYPIVKKHPDEHNYKKNSGNYHNPKSASNDADEEPNKNQRNDRRRKALAVEEKSGEKNDESCTSSSSSESDSSEDEKGLLCLFSQEDSDEELCLMADEEEALIYKSFDGIEDSHLKLKEENAKLLAEKQDLEDLRSKNAEMLESISQLEKQVHLLEEECKAKDDREQNLRAGRPNSYPSNVKNFKKFPSKHRDGEGTLYPSDEDWIMDYEPMTRAKFLLHHRHKQTSYTRVNTNKPTPPLQNVYSPKSPQAYYAIPYDYRVFNGYRGPRMNLTSSRYAWMPKLTANRQGPKKENRTIWYVDSSCSRHMTGDKSELSNYKAKNGPKVVFGGNSSGRTMGTGDVMKNGLIIQEISYVEGLKFNLLSTTKRRKNMYVVTWETVKPNTCLITKSKKDLSWEWHHKLNHLNFKATTSLQERNWLKDYRM
ncbi:uncharacterized protein LOC116013211 [Ipomoea triloba]|uniref:uncharacterized protein LOC116013211 n=1 Tax=Ipomoea triloba TaxID=35885 RepID=UPI00125D5AEC|nr:uncharacterized protein LOC116013211 [Ipomoea triloba]